MSCKSETPQIKLLKVTEYSSSKLSDTALVKILRDQNNLDIQIDYTLSEDHALKRLNNDDVDLVIIPNNAGRNNYKFKFLAPLTPRVLMIYTNRNVGGMDLKNIFEEGEIFFEGRSRLDSLFFKKLYYHFNIDKNKIKTPPINEIDFTKKNKKLLVYVGLTHLNNEIIKALSNLNWSLFSLDKIENLGKGSRVEGFNLMNSFSYPFVIPEYTYHGNPDKPVLTLAIKDILISKKKFNEDLAYDIIKTIAENEADLAKVDDVYNLLNFDVQRQKWAYPFHESTKKYLSKDKPSIWMGYINNILIIASIIVIIFGAASSFQTIVRKKKRYKIETYYYSLNDIRERALIQESSEGIHLLLSELNKVKAKAIHILAHNKFDSSESFDIFLILHAEIQKELKEKIEELRTDQ